MKPKLLVSVSNGRSSAYMAAMLKQHKADEYDLLFVCAAPGLEHEDSARFMRAVDRHYDLGVVYVEAAVHYGERKSSTHIVVGENSLCMDGSVYEEVIKKYGLPNKAFPHCTRELKINPIHSFAESVWGTDYWTALGIRADEPERISPTAEAQQITYPLVSIWPTDKIDVLQHFAPFPWDLQIEEELGNCVDCFKKSDKKLNAAYHKSPWHFLWRARMEEKYGHIKPPNDKREGPRATFRGHRSAKQMIALFEHLGPPPPQLFDREKPGGCSESCEADLGARIFREETAPASAERAEGERARPTPSPES